MHPASSRPCCQEPCLISFYVNLLQNFVVYMVVKWNPVAHMPCVEVWKIPAANHQGHMAPSKVGWSKAWHHLSHETK